MSFRTSLRARLGSWMLLLSVGPLVGVTLLAGLVVTSQLGRFSHRLDEAERSLETDVVGNNLRGDAFDAAVEIDDVFIRMVMELRNWSEEDVVVQAAQAGDRVAQSGGWMGREEGSLETRLNGRFTLPLSPSLSKAAASYLFRQSERPGSGVVEILVTGKNGYNTLVTRPVQKIDHHQESWWKSASAKDGLGYVEPFLDPMTQTPVVGLALPVVDTRSGAVSGVIRAFFRFDDLQNILAQKAIGLNADIRVLDRRGRILVDTKSNNSPQVILGGPNSDWGASDPGFRSVQAPSGFRGAGFLRTGDQLVGFAHTFGEAFYTTQGFAKFSGLDLGVTVSQPQARALKVLDPLRTTADEFQRLPWILAGLSGLIMALVVLISIIAAVFVSRGITRPLVALSREALRVQEGDLSAQVVVETEDEIGVLGSTFNTMTMGLRERDREREVFGKVVSPEVREKLLSGHLSLGGETRRVSVLFSDIRGFSTMAESVSAEDVVSFLNEYLTAMSEAILPWGGYINNFIGDAIVVIFGAPLELPDQEYRAVRAALDMRSRLARLNRERRGRGLDSLESGIGISTGEAVAGQIGSLSRLQYTVIGDAVNVAARLETLTKNFEDRHILINPATASALVSYPEISLTSLGFHELKGRREKVEVFAVDPPGDPPD